LKYRGLNQLRTDLIQRIINSVVNMYSNTKSKAGLGNFPQIKPGYCYEMADNLLTNVSKFSWPIR